DAKEPAREGAKSGGVELAAADQAEGNRQFDYLVRLVRRMRAEGSYRAIGVLGGDVYDKLLLLRALRAEFKDVLFFTTDLDARLTQPAENDYVRNLLVASHYGLALHPDLQGPNPPFRAIYQTSNYLGFLKALGFAPLAKAINHNHDRRLWDDYTAATPRLFEIGRTGAYDLSLEPNDAIHARGSRVEPWALRDSRRWWFGLAALIVFASAIGFSARMQRLLWLRPATDSEDRADALRARNERKRLWQIRIGTAFHLLAFAALVVVAVAAHLDPEGEPLEFTEGISAWPTLAVRLIATLLAIAFLARGLRHIASFESEICEGFGIPMDPRPALSRASGLSRILVWLREFNSDDPQKDVRAKIAAYYGGFDKPLEPPDTPGPSGRTAGVIRVCLLFGAYAVAFLCLCQVWEFPPYPGRGSLGWWANAVVFWSMTTALLLLLVYVVDISFLTYHFVRDVPRMTERLLESNAGGPRARKQQLREKYGLISPPAGTSDAVETVLGRRLAIDVVQQVGAEPSQAIQAPFVVLFFLVIGQTGLFDNWQWNAPLAALVAIGGTTALVCSLMLQRASRQAKADALLDVDAEIAALPPAVVQREPALVERLKGIRAEIESSTSGALAGWKDNPVLRAILLPALGGSGVAIFELLSKFF
ncbi:MAG TPA: hypothetical protein VNC50_09625, partial [Planctomycetia bacterium]|nr:hypothetical protein [Planctomycetia bacterium]